MTADPIRERAEAPFHDRAFRHGNSLVVFWHEAVEAVEAALRESHPKQPEPEDPDLVEAREIAAVEVAADPALAEAYRSGLRDNSPSMRIALAALRSRPKRQVCQCEAYERAGADRLGYPLPPAHTTLVKGTAPPEQDEMTRKASAVQNELAGTLGGFDSKVPIIRAFGIRCHREGFNEALEKAKGALFFTSSVIESSDETRRRIDALKMQEAK